MNLSGTFTAAGRRCARLMKARDAGRIINITSITGESGSAGQAPYVAAKAGIIGLTKTLAREYASRGVTVNAVSPGYIETDMTASELPPARRAELLKTIPLGRVGTTRGRGGRRRLSGGSRRRLRHRASLARQRRTFNVRYAPPNPDYGTRNSVIERTRNNMADDIEEKVKKIIIEQLEVAPDKVKPEASFAEDLKADSLAVVELVLALEEQFKLEIPDEDTEKIKTVGDAINYIKSHAKK